MKYRFTFALLLYVCLAQAQPMPQLDSTTIYCGVFKADSGKYFPVEKRFEIKNVGDEPLIIQAGLGNGGGAYLHCHKEPIAPSESGECVFHYGSLGATKFTRRLKLHWYGPDGLEEILMSFTGVKKNYAYEGPHLKIKQRVFDLDTVSGGRNRIDNTDFYTVSVMLVNVGNQTAILTGASTSDGGTMMSWPKEPIMPGDTAVCIFH